MRSELLRPGNPFGHQFRFVNLFATEHFEQAVGLGEEKAEVVPCAVEPRVALDGLAEGHLGVGGLAGFGEGEGGAVGDMLPVPVSVPVGEPDTVPEGDKESVAKPVAVPAPVGAALLEAGAVGVGVPEGEGEKSVVVVTAATGAAAAEAALAAARDAVVAGDSGGILLHGMSWFHHRRRS